MRMKLSLSFADYLLFGLVLLGSSLVGVYHKLTGGRQATTKEYLMADRSMGLWPVAFSLMASFMSAITLIGVPAENYFYSTQFLAINISYAIGTPIAAFVFLPVFYQMNATSAYEYLERRFNGFVRRLASGVFMIQMILYMGVVLYAPALALSAVTDLSKWASIISVGLVCTMYCVTGGIKAILWADLFQSLLMFMAMIMVIVKGTMDVGGVNDVWMAAERGNRLQFWNTDPDPTTRHTIWSLMFGGIFIYVSIYGVNQTQVQRLLTVKSLRKSQIALFLSWPITSLLSLCSSAAGIVMYAYFKDCDPLKNEEVTKSDQMLPLMVMKVFAHLPGFPGFFIAGIFSGALSTVSSFVNSLAAVTLEDYIKPLIYKNSISDKKSVLLSKLLACFYGLLCLAVTYLVEQMHSVLEASLTIFGVVGGPLLGLYTLGMCTRSCTSMAASVSFMVSLALGIVIGFGSLMSGLKPVALETSTAGCSVNITALTTTTLSTIYDATTSASSPIVDPEQVFYLFRISYMWYAGLTWSTTIILGALISLFSRNTKHVADSLLCPMLRSNVKPGESTEIQKNGVQIYTMTEEHEFHEAKL